MSEYKVMTKGEIDIIKSRLATITEWPWEGKHVERDLFWTGEYFYTNHITNNDGEVICILEERTNDDVDTAFIANAPADIARLLAEVERLNKVSRYLAEQMVHDGGAGLRWAGAFDEDCMRMYKTKEEAIQSWIDEANREVSNA